MWPWYLQILTLVAITVVVYPIIVLLLLKYYYFPSLMKSVVDECFKKQEEHDLEQALTKTLEVPVDENPLVSGGCEVQNGLIVRNDENSEFEW